jgi:hypothetical protein
VTKSRQFLNFCCPKHTGQQLRQHYDNKNMQKRVIGQQIKER